MNLLDDTLSVIDMEGRLKGDERRVGDFDCVWDEGPIAPIANASKNFLSDLWNNFNLTTDLQTRANISMSSPTGNARNQQVSRKKTIGDWLPIPPINSYLGCLSTQKSFGVKFTAP